jgi:hypothetical protein
MIHLALLAVIVGAADKCQMPHSLVKACKALYSQRGEDILKGLSYGLILDAITPIKIIYGSSPALARGEQLLSSPSLV